MCSLKFTRYDGLRNDTANLKFAFKYIWAIRLQFNAIRRSHWSMLSEYSSTQINACHQVAEVNLSDRP